MLTRWGSFVYRRRWAVFVLSAAFVALAIAGIAEGTAPSFNGNSTGTESASADQLVTQQLPAKNAGSMTLLYRSGTLTASDPAFRTALLSSVGPLQADQRVQSIVTPYDGGQAAAALVSRDQHEALAVVTLKDDRQASRATYSELHAELGPAGPLQVLGTGDLAINDAFTTQLGHDLSAASRTSLPITAILLLLVFGTVVAALLPLGVGALAVAGGFAGIFVLARFVDVSQYATDLTALIGLGVGIDYSLFIVSRYREELARGDSPQESLQAAMATAGRSVIFSALTVAIGLSGLLFFQGSYLATMGLGGAFAVAAAVVYAFTLLPALLAILGRRVNWLRLPVVGRQASGRGFWHLVANQVMRRPVLALLPALAILAVLASPVRSLQLGSGGIKLLPPQNEARYAFDQIAQNFPHRDQEVIPVVLHYGSGDPLSASRSAYADRLAASISGMPGVLSVDNPAGASASPALRQSSVGASIVELQVHSAYQPSSDQAKSLVAAIRNEAGPPGGSKLVGGNTAFTQDDVAWIASRTPAAAVFVVLVTYVVLFLLVGSLLLPLKAVVMNLVSLGAAFGAIVWIFQEGHLSGWLNFTPQTQDPSIAVLIFCILFGLSMDYEVLMLNRIREEWQRTGDTRAAVATGLERSGRLITGAAAIMVAVFASFGLGSGTVLIKALGLGLAVAITVDATLVRAVVVPAVMRLLGDLNWWAPGPLARLQRRLALGEPVESEIERQAA
jgi:putative drug exporter of the RND superfamily